MSELEQATAALGTEQPLNDAPPVASELDTLKARADQVGLTYHPKIGVDALRSKLNEFLTGEPAEPDSESPGAAEQALADAMTAPSLAKAAAPVQAHRAESLVVEPVAYVASKEKYRTPKQIADTMQPPRQDGESLVAYRNRKRAHALALVRVVLTCMNPAKREWDGEIFTVGNSLVGSITKFVPFNNEEGWHIPRIMYNLLRDRECQIFVTVTDPNKNKIRKGKMIKEFSIDVLEPLNAEELQELKERQALARSVD